MRHLIIGTRGSHLALWQAEYTQNLLSNIGIGSEIKIIKTKGDSLQKLPDTFLKNEGKGIFTKELEDALLRKDIDLAVHSLKDLPVELPEGLTLGGVPAREDARDVLLIKKPYFDEFEKFNLKKNSVVGTSSLRRKNQLEFHRPDIRVVPVRGNVPTRIDKFLRSGELHALMLAKAGLNRLNVPQETSNYVCVVLKEDEVVPSPAQGALAWEIRKDDHELCAVLQSISCPSDTECTESERRLMKRLGAGCHAPLGIFVEKKNPGFTLYASFSDHPKKSPVFFWLNGKHLPALEEEAQKILSVASPRKILISREPEKWIKIRKSLEDNGHAVCMQSFIHAETIEPQSFPEHDAVFFCSPRSIEYYFKFFPVPYPGTFIGCLGEGTAGELRRKSVVPSFIGQGNNHEDIMKKFLSHCPGKKILIPVAFRHSPVIEKVFCDASKHFIISVYKISSAAVTIPGDFDIYMFTSPSNVRSFYKNGGRITDKAMVIALGEPTTECLKQHGIQHVQTAPGYKETDVLSEIYRTIARFG